MVVWNENVNEATLVIASLGQQCPFVPTRPPEASWRGHDRLQVRAPRQLASPLLPRAKVLGAGLDRVRRARVSLEQGRAARAGERGQGEGVRGAQGKGKGTV